MKLNSRRKFMVDKQEPVAWQFFDNGKWHYGTYLHDHRKNTEKDGYPVRDLYTSPPRKPWVGLTDDELSDLWSWSMTHEAERFAPTQKHAFARAIEAALKEKNHE